MLRRRINACAAVLAVTLALPLLYGCGGGGGSPNPVDSDRAREYLKAVLDTWKKGESIDSLKTGSPAITAQDFDWLAGASLVDYEVAGEGTPIDANLRVPVKLTVRSKGKETKKSVSYLVTTSPAVTVFRDFKK